MARIYSSRLSLSIGSDPVEWEGEATVTYSVTWGRPAVWYLRNGDPGYPADPDEVSDITVTHIDGAPVASREHGKHEAETLQDHIWASDALLSDLIAEAGEQATADAVTALRQAAAQAEAR